MLAVRYVREAGPWQHANKHQSRSLTQEYFLYFFAWMLRINRSHFMNLLGWGRD